MGAEFEVGGGCRRRRWRKGLEENTNDNDSDDNSISHCNVKKCKAPELFTVYVMMAIFMKRKIMIR